MKNLTNPTMIKQLAGVVATGLLAFAASSAAQAAVELEKTYQVTDNALYFNGVQSKSENSPNKNHPQVIDFAFGKSISAHGDAIKVYKNFIFTTWYKGGKSNRNLMLSRHNLETGVTKTIQFPHKHTGFRGITHVGESHNTAAVGISPKDGKIHILYDMHSYDNSQFNNDYFRYSYSVEDAATVADRDFKLSLFVADGHNDYGHNNLNGRNDPGQFSDLTYPTFFLNENDDLLFYMRTGGNNNGGYVFTSYNANTGKWANITRFNHMDQARRSNSVSHNWGLYGHMKYVNGKLRTAFQIRSANNNDRYKYQNGVYYAYSNDQSGKTNWKNHKGQGFNIPFANPAPLKVFEPGNWIDNNRANRVWMVGGMDFTVTDRGDVHIVSRVKDLDSNKEVKIHSYKPAGRAQSANFTHDDEFDGGSSLYTSGNNVYIIGLKDGRPSIQKTSGGTSNFTTIYEDTRGDKYGHGVVHVHEGKVYYFLQKRLTENDTDRNGNIRYTTRRDANGNRIPKKRDRDSQPLYVQIIDLGLNDSNNRPQQPVAQGPEGYTFAANAGETVDVRGTMDVAFGANDSFNFQLAQTSDLQCVRSVFGDPAPGVVKKCYVKSVATQQPPVSGLQCQNYWGDEKKEINLNNGACVNLPKDLRGRTLQVWDSDNASCDFRGKVKTINGDGTLVVDSNYESAINLTGRKILFDGSNNCKFVQMRLF